MSASPDSLVAAVLSPQPELAQAFMATLCGEGALKGQVNLNNMADVVVEIPPAEPIEATIEHIKSADFAILLLRFVDEETLDVARALLRALPPAVQAGIHIALAREQGEGEFKMSCPKCGQKLLIKDALAFRRTQCPRCKHPFTIPGQTDLVRQEFLIPPEHKISKAQLGDTESCMAVLRSAYRQVGGRRSDEKSQTMRLDDLIVDGPEDGAGR